MTSKIIPLYKPIINREEKINVNKCLNDNWISSNGEFISKFEKKFSNYTKIKYCATTSNGTVALHLALRILNIKKNDEVIVPAFTYIASVNCISYVGAKPVFCESDINTGQIDVKDIQKRITKKTKAIIVPHLYGNVGNISELIKIKKRFNLFIVEDCAEAIGSFYKKKHVGNFGDISTFSFFGSKTITTGEGGMICTNEISYFLKAQKLKGQGLSKKNNKLYYWHDEIGYNYRMTNICAALGLAQMKKLNDILKKKKILNKRYIEGLNKDKIKFLSTDKNSESSYWLNCILLDNAKKRDKLMKYLKRFNIETRNTFYLASEMKMYKNKKLSFLKAKALSSKGLCLPSYPNITHQDLKSVIRRINDFIKKN
ncbi:DegT/DnrH/EryC1/StrS aminotransferase family protein [alpha proteobacterium HIMB5]|nr:DegT/DnrH/EryC1/StrS aminotransferase family protein [alpha proteobacterium HIMB5]